VGRGAFEWAEDLADCTELSAEAKVRLADAVVPGVRGPHAGEDLLGHGAKILLHGPLANWPTVGGKVACADLVGKRLEEGEGIVDSGEEGVESELGAELAPLSPVEV
jgi:hypothetical protein